MAQKTEVPLDLEQVKKAVQALQAFMKNKSTGDSLFSDDGQQISLLFTLWKIPKIPQTIRIPLPHGHQQDTEVCLFTRDEPNMTSDQTQRFYKKLLETKGIKNITEIIPYKVLKTEYKPFEAKRRLLGNFNMFLSDDRIRRLLPSHLGRHFYERKKEPLSVKLLSKDLARDIGRIIQGTRVKVTNKGCCCMARVANSTMTADEVTENIEATVKTFMAKVNMKGPVIKLIHLKSEKSVALPIYTSNLSHLTLLDDAQRAANATKSAKEMTDGGKQTQTAAEAEKGKKVAGKKKRRKKQKAGVGKDVEKEEEIPQLVPIETPSKKPKLEKAPKKKQLKKAPQPPAAKKATKAPNKLAKKAVDSKAKRNVPKVK